MGLYALLIKNILYKTKWNNYHFTEDEEKISLVFSVLLFLMENSLREDACTLDDIGAYLDDLNASFYHKALSFSDCRELGDFIVNQVLLNDGVLMNFKGYDYDIKEYVDIPVRYVANEVVYIKGEVKRTSYHLTDEGYSLLLSTLEVEENLRITVQELLFQMHLDKQSYDKAVDDVKEIFNQIRIQQQRIGDAMTRIRRNALSYSVSEYGALANENLESIKDAMEKFKGHREVVQRRRLEIEEIHVNVRKLNPEEEEKLENLKIIGSYLGRTLDEYQKVLSKHLELKDLYSKELENIAQTHLVRRFSLREKLYEEILKKPDRLSEFGLFLSPLLIRQPDKAYNLRKAAQPQRSMRGEDREEEAEDIEFDEEYWEAERLRKINERRLKYRGCLKSLICEAAGTGDASLYEIAKKTHENEEMKINLIPDIDIFKEVIIELLKARVLDIGKLKEERQQSFREEGEGFSLGTMLLDILEELELDNKVDIIFVRKTGDRKVSFSGIRDSDGASRTIRCSEVKISLVY